MMTYHEGQNSPTDESAPLRIILRNNERIRLSDAKQGDTLVVYENEDDLVAGIGVRWELSSDAYLPDLSKHVWACEGTIHRLEQ